jgi:Zn-finger nucleic acid-binding protein
MVCPVCDKDMLVLEFELVEIDHCSECGGVWLDSGELALIGKRAGALHGDLLAALESGQGEPDKTRPKRRCPVCRKRLLPARTNSGRNTLVEKCPRGDGLWFEAGSLQAVIQAAGADGRNVFARFLADLEARRSGAAVLKTRSASSPVHRGP